MKEDTYIPVFKVYACRSEIRVRDFLSKLGISMIIIINIIIFVVIVDINTGLIIVTFKCIHTVA